MRSFLQVTSCRALALLLVFARIESTLLRSRPLAQALKFSHRSAAAPIDAMIGYDWISGVERLEAYGPGGYHLVMIGDVMHTRYTIIDKLGFGGYSTVWLVRDSHTDSFVALKVGISRASPAQREYQVLGDLSNSTASTKSVVQAKIGPGLPIPSVLDSFEVQGPNGKHRCYTMDLIQGDLRAASYSRLFPIRVARALTAKLVLAVDYVHSQGFVHGDVLAVWYVITDSWLTYLPDIRLCNVLVKAAPTISNLSIDQFREQYGQPETVPVSRTDGKDLPLSIPSQVVLPLDLSKKAQNFTLDDAAGLVLSDFGEAFAPATEQRLGRECNTPAVNKVPEAFFEPDRSLTQASDVWSLGVATWEILGMKAIFSESEPEAEVIAEQIDVLGAQCLPDHWRAMWDSQNNSVARCRVSEEPKAERETWPPLQDAFEDFIQVYRRRWKDTAAFSEEETRMILCLIRGMLRFNPKDRLTTQEVLKSDWMVGYALRELQYQT